MWYAVKTRYKCEKQVQRHLELKAIECYLPLLKRTRKYRRKVKRYEVPLINCYVFVRIDLKDRAEVLSNYNVIDFLRIGSDIIPVCEEEISIMKRVVGELDEVEIGPWEWHEGDEVEVIAGSLTGLSGILLSRAGKHEFVVRLESLGYQLRMNIDESLLRRLPHRISA